MAFDFNLEEGKLIDDFIALAIMIPDGDPNTIGSKLEELTKNHQCTVAPNAKITIPELKAGIFKQGSGEVKRWGGKAIADQLKYCMLDKLDQAFGKAGITK